MSNWETENARQRYVYRKLGTTIEGGGELHDVDRCEVGGGEITMVKGANRYRYNPASGAWALCLILALVACGASQRTKTLSVTLAAADAASAELVSYDHDRQAVIVAAAKDEASGHAELVAFRAKITDAEKTIATLYRAIALAALKDDDMSISVALQAAAILSQELKQLGVIR